MNNVGKTFASAMLVLLATVVIGIMLAWPIMWLWNNCLVGAIDGINEIGFYQAYGLWVLVSITTNKTTVKSKS